VNLSDFNLNPQRVTVEDLRRNPAQVLRDVSAPASGQNQTEEDKNRVGVRIWSAVVGGQKVQYAAGSGQKGIPDRTVAVVRTSRLSVMSACVRVKRTQADIGGQ
jgi:hypothetical protein